MITQNHIPEFFGLQMGINFSGGNAGMAQHFLDIP